MGSPTTISAARLGANDGPGTLAEVATGGNLATLANLINQAHQSVQAAITEGLQHAKAAGELLLQAKAQCPHGAWGSWLDDNFQGSDRTAQRYMTIAKRWPELEAKATRVSDLPFREAVKLLTETRAKREGADEFLQTVRREEQAARGAESELLRETLAEIQAETERIDATGQGMSDIEKPGVRLRGGRSLRWHRPGSLR